jgi:hypothetical protein
MKRVFFSIILLFLALSFGSSQEHTIGAPSSWHGTSANAFKIARLQYSGGGDWYNDPSCEVNMMDYLKKNTVIDVDESKFYTVDISSDDIFNYPFIFMTGHGNISFSDSEVKRLRTYLERGGFLYADDDYGMDIAFRREIKKVFPDQEMKELPFNHKIYNIHFNFPGGLPKTHEHDSKPPQGFGYFINGRLCCYYTYETNISDGWADQREHEDPADKREEAFKMGTNIIVYALSN